MITASNQKFCGAIMRRENGFPGCRQGSRSHGHLANLKGLLNVTNSTANRSRRQDVLDRSWPVAGSSLALRWAIRERSLGNGFHSERQSHLEGIAPLGPDKAPARCCSKSAKITHRKAY